MSELPKTSWIIVLDNSGKLYALPAHDLSQNEISTNFAKMLVDTEKAQSYMTVPFQAKETAIMSAKLFWKEFGASGKKLHFREDKNIHGALNKFRESLNKM